MGADNKYGNTILLAIVFGILAGGITAYAVVNSQTNNRSINQGIL